MNNKLNTKILAILSIAIMLLSMPFAFQVNAASTAQSSILMGNMPKANGAGISGTLPSGSTADITVDSRAFLSFSPTTIGVGQTLLVNMWVNPPISPNRYLNGFTVDIMRPDGTTFTVGPFNSFAADATAWFSMIVDEAGTWKLKFNFAGDYYPAGNYGTNGEIVTTGTTGSYALESAYYKPDSTDWQVLTVQDDMVWSWPLNELPTDYWTRPVHFENRAWWPILGSYPGYGVIGGGSNWPEDTNIYNSNYNFVPYVTAPDSAHVVFKEQVGLAGMIGGTAGQYGQTARGGPSVIYMGRAYETQTVAINGVPTSCAVCYDIRTGEQYYAIPVSQGGVTPQVVSYTPPGTGAVEGSGGDQTYSVSLISLASNRLIKIDPYSGAVTLNVTGMTPQLLGGAQGSVSQTGFYADPYVISVQTIGSGPSLQYRLINWTTAGSSTNFTSRIMNNVSLPWGYVSYGGGILAYAGIVADFESNVMVWMMGLAPNSLGVYHGTWMMAADMTTGQLLWNRTYTETRYSTASFTADHGLVACVMEEGSYYAYDIYTGDFKWKTEQMAYPWASAGFGAYSVQSAYGILFRETYNGVYAFNWTNGETLWHFVSEATPFETPYTYGNESVYSFNGFGLVADGKLFTFNTEHTPSWPRTRGWKLFAIDVFSGECVWNITSAISPNAIADGYLVSINPDDGYVYSFGKGQSVTTVSAPQTEISLGSSIMISGTVLDKSPAQEGTPCVSSGSMTNQMEYLHMQLPIDGIYHNVSMTGVPVKLTAIDPNGNIIEIGTATSNAYYGTFDFAWAPDKEGTYTIMASFEGDESYGSSGASTAIIVGAAATTPAPTEVANNNLDSLSGTMTTLTVGMGIAIIATVIIVGLLLLRKK